MSDKKMKSKKEEHRIFFLKVLRNCFILTGLFFLTHWYAEEISKLLIKQIAIFALGYIFVELANYYKIKMPLGKRATLFL